MSTVPERRLSGESAVRYEPKDVPPLLPVWLAAGLASFIAIVLIGITLGFPLAVHQQSRGPLQPLPPTPRLQVAPAQDLKQYQASKSRELERGGMPIEAAMRATAAQGWGPPR